MTEETETDQKPANRGVFSRILKNAKMSTEAATDVAAADDWMDDALEALDYEEPTLLAFLQDDPEIPNAMWAFKSVCYWILRRDLNRGLPLIEILTHVNTLTSRLTAAIALRAVMLDRQGRSGS